jgi:hypothetical protein
MCLDSKDLSSIHACTAVTTMWMLLSSASSIHASSKEEPGRQQIKEHTYGDTGRQQIKEHTYGDTYVLQDELFVNMVCEISLLSSAQSIMHND